MPRSDEHDKFLEAIRPGRTRYDRLLDTVQFEYVGWLGPLLDKTDTEKMQWWFAKAKQLVVRIAELEEELEKKGG